MKELLKIADMNRRLDLLEINRKTLENLRTILNDDNEEVVDLINYLNANNIEYTLSNQTEYFRITLI